MSGRHFSGGGVTGRSSEGSGEREEVELPEGKWLGM